MESYLVRATADVGLPAVGPELAVALDLLTAELDSCGAAPVQVAVRGDALGIVVAVGCVARDRTDANVEALEWFTAALGGTGLDFNDVRLA
jgi:hypothetical protein